MDIHEAKDIIEKGVVGGGMLPKLNNCISAMDFHGGSKLSKLTYPIKTIYSKEAREKLRLVLDDFQPDVCHMNNFNYQLTPSIPMIMLLVFLLYQSKVMLN